jgi:hypothetical protein
MRRLFEKSTPLNFLLFGISLLFSLLLAEIVVALLFPCTLVLRDILGRGKLEDRKYPYDFEEKDFQPEVNGFQHTVVATPII